MSYATLDDIETRYPGWLTMAGPKTPANALDEDAIDLALAAADETINLTLNTIGWTVPVTAIPTPSWIIVLAVDLTAYLAATTGMASADVLKDCRQRYEDALKTLQDIASGRLLPVPPDGVNSAGVAFTAPPRQFIGDFF